MKNNFVHVCFIIDKSGSMHGSESDIIGGFKSVIEEQTKNPDITCAISLYTFNQTTDKIYIGKPVAEVNTEIEYVPEGCTAMNDAIGKAVTEIGQWLSDMPEEERPEKNIIVIMTDGEENSSVEYNIDTVKDMITEQQDKYSWSFMYLGANISDASYANQMNFRNNAYMSKSSMSYCAAFSSINTCLNKYATFDNATKSSDLDAALAAECNDMTADYLKDGNTVKNL